MFKFDEWITSVAILLGWIGLAVIVVPVLFRWIRRKATATRTDIDDMILRAVSVPLSLVLVGIGLRIFTDSLPVADQLHTYFRAGVVVLFVYSGILFLDRLVIGFLKGYSGRVAFVESSGGILRTRGICDQDWLEKYQNQNASEQHGGDPEFETCRNPDYQFLPPGTGDVCTGSSRGEL